MANTPSLGLGNANSIFATLIERYRGYIRKMSKTYKVGTAVKTYWTFKLGVILLLCLGGLIMQTISFSRYYTEAVKAYNHTSYFKKKLHKKARNYWKRLFRKEKIEQ